MTMKNIIRTAPLAVLLSATAIPGGRVLDNVQSRQLEGKCNRDIPPKIFLGKGGKVMVRAHQRDGDFTAM